MSEMPPDPMGAHGHVHVDMPPPLERVLADNDANGGNDPALLAALRDREDRIKDVLSTMASALGSEPRLVAGALMLVGLGTPPDQDTREFIMAQFRAGQEWLAELVREQGGE
jgi:hypothetical protein